MNTLIYIKSYLSMLMYQGLPGFGGGGGGETDIDAAPIDDYLVVGLIAAVLMIVFYAYQQKKAKLSK